MNKIVWNQVTWYSKLLAVILFVVTFYIGFSLGEKGGEIKKDAVPAPVANISTPINIVSYKCDDSKTINAKFYQGVPKPTKPDEMPIPTGSVELTLSDGRSLNIPQTISADGGRYANEDESFVFWSKGNGAFVTETSSKKNTYDNCVVTSQTLKN